MSSAAIFVWRLKVNWNSRPRYPKSKALTTRLHSYRKTCIIGKKDIFNSS